MRAQSLQRSGRPNEKRREIIAGQTNSGGSLASSVGAALNSRERTERETTQTSSGSRENSVRKGDKEEDKEEDVNLKIFRNAASLLTVCCDWFSLFVLSSYVKSNKNVSKMFVGSKEVPVSSGKWEFRRMLKLTIVGSFSHVVCMMRFPINFSFLGQCVAINRRRWAFSHRYVRCA